MEEVAEGECMSKKEELKIPTLAQTARIGHALPKPRGAVQPPKIRRNLLRFQARDTQQGQGHTLQAEFPARWVIPFFERVSAAASSTGA
jgi:hypothetical protein